MSLHDFIIESNDKVMATKTTGSLGFTVNVCLSVGVFLSLFVCVCVLATVSVSVSVAVTGSRKSISLKPDAYWSKLNCEYVLAFNKIRIK